jgi:predicted metal-dependent hydrolase
MLQITLMFWTIVFWFHVRLLIADRRRGGHVRGVWNLVRFLFGPRGVFPHIALDWLRFFKPSFHPWDHDNRKHLARIDAVVAAVEAAGGRDGSRAVRTRMIARSQTQA